MTKPIDITGQRFGKLIVIEKVKNPQDSVKWRCRCECGKEKIATSSNLRSGNTVSCGCVIGYKYQPGMVEKPCKRCGTIKKIREFRATKHTRKDGHISICYVATCRKCEEASKTPSTPFGYGTRHINPYLTMKFSNGIAYHDDGLSYYGPHPEPVYPDLVFEAPHAA